MNLTDGTQDAASRVVCPCGAIFGAATTGPAPKPVACHAAVCNRASMMSRFFDLSQVGSNGLFVELWSITEHLSGRQVKVGNGFYEPGQDHLRLRSPLAPDVQTLVVYGMTGRNALRADRVRERLIAAGQPLRLRLTTDLVEFTAKNGPKRGQFISYRVARFHGPNT